MNCLFYANIIKATKRIAFLFAVFFLCVFIRVFLFEIYYVPSGSMENCLYEGDIILVSKIHYGARIPLSISDIPWMNLFENGSDTSSIIFSDKRIKGISKIEKGDIVIFNKPNDKNAYNVKRCIALPKDLLFISDEIVKVNGCDFVNDKYVKMKYSICYEDKNHPFNSIMKELSIPYSETRYHKISSNKEVYLTNMQKNQITHRLGDSIKIKYSSNILYYQNILMPYVGEMVFSLDSLPREIFKYEKKCSKYIISQNYFFFLGDNRDVSIDSRYFGVIPENHIVGKVVLVLFSTNVSRIFSEKRIFKFIY